MAGHSHWAGIKHKKAATDKKRGKVFSKIANLIISAARNGGGDPETNLALRYAIEKGRAANMPRDTIARAIKKGTGELAGEEIHELTYEAYAPGGVALLIHTITDNVNRTGADVKSMLEKRGGTLGKQGSVSWNFERKALFTVATSAIGEEELFDLALEAGAEDVADEGEFFCITAPPESFATLAAALEAKELKPDTSELTDLPKSRVMLDADAARKVLALIELLEDHEDVQTAITNADLPEEVLAELGS